MVSHPGLRELWSGCLRKSVRQQALIRGMKARCVYPPAAEEDVVGPHHWEGEQVVQLRVFKVIQVPQDELPPGLPVLVALPVASVVLHLLGHSSVLLDKILNVQGRHLALPRPRQQKRLPVLSSGSLKSSYSPACFPQRHAVMEQSGGLHPNVNSNSQYFICSVLQRYYEVP